MLKKIKKMCSFDVDLDFFIHRFDIGARICRCGEKEVAKMVRSQRPGFFGKGYINTPKKENK